jgi:hypothetical protein
MITIEESLTSGDDIKDYPVLALVSEINIKKQFITRLRNIMSIGIEKVNQATKILIGSRYYKVLSFDSKTVVDSIFSLVNEPKIEEKTIVCVVELLLEVAIICSEDEVYNSDIWLRLEFLTKYGRSYDKLYIDLYTKCLLVLAHSDMSKFQQEIGSNYTVLLRGKFIELCDDYRYLKPCLCGNIVKYSSEIHSIFGRLMQMQNKYYIFNKLREDAIFQSNMLSFIMTNLLRIEKESSNHVDLSVFDYYLLLILYFDTDTVELLFERYGYSITNKSRLMSIWLKNEEPRPPLLEFAIDIAKFMMSEKDVTENMADILISLHDSILTIEDKKMFVLMSDLLCFFNK